MLQFDAGKDVVKLEKHGISLARAADMEGVVVIVDGRKEYREPRYRAFGWIDGVAHCLAFTIRGRDMRAISLRRAHSREMNRYVAQTK